MQPRPGALRGLWILVVLLSAIGMAIVIRRAVALAGPVTQEALDAGFARHALLTRAHILPGLLFIILGPFQFIRTLRNRRPRLHRWMGRLFVASSVAVGCTALVMSPQMSIGGPSETAATLFFGVLFLIAVLKGFVHIRRREVALHREWMIRAYAIGLAVTTIRPIVGVFFATRALTHWTPRDFFGAAFWLGFTAHLIAAEVWINYTRRSVAQPFSGARLSARG